MKFDYEKASTREFALKELCELWSPKREIEHVSLDEAFDRITAQDVFAQYNLPVTRSSRFDGIGVKSENFKDGVPNTSAWKRGQDFCQADTGDDFPDEFDAVVAREQFEFNENQEPVFEDNLEPVFAGDGINPSGATIKKGELVIPAHYRLTPEYVALCAVGGHATLPVLKKPVVAFIPTGSELIPWGSAPKRGQNIEANSLMVRGFVEAWGGRCISYPVVSDDPDLLEDALDRALEIADIIFINGGSSRGEEDFNSEMLKRRASHFRHGVRTVPGRPVGMSIIENTPVINIPGPVGAAFLCCDWLLRGLLAYYLASAVPNRPSVRAKLSHDINKKKAFERVLRVKLKKLEDESFVCTPLKASAIVENIFEADGMVAVPIGVDFVAEGEELEVLLLKPLDAIK